MQNIPEDSMRNPFEILGISRGLVKEFKHDDEVLINIAKSMKNVLSKLFHPDMNPDGGTRMSEINVAFDFIERHCNSSYYQILKEEYVKGVKKPRTPHLKYKPLLILPRPVSNLEVVFLEGSHIRVDSCGNLRQKSAGKTNWFKLPGRFLVATLSPSYLHGTSYTPVYPRVSKKLVAKKINKKINYSPILLQGDFKDKILCLGEPTLQP